MRIKTNFSGFLLRILQGALIGLGSVLPGISGGVLSVVFGVYKPIMELLSNPKQHLKTHFPLLLPVFLGGAVGFLGIANLLSFFLERYPAPSVCLFIGLIAGMFPSLLREAGEKGRSRSSLLSMGLCALGVFLLLLGLSRSSFTITPNFPWYLFCGFCFALSVIAPGMSFSTLLMPLGLYTPFVDGLGHLDSTVLLPSVLGAAVTVICLAKAVNALFERHYSLAFHGIAGIVAAATIMIFPLESFLSSARQCFINLLFLFAGVVAAVLLDGFNQRTGKHM